MQMMPFNAPARPVDPMEQETPANVQPQATMAQQALETPQEAGTKEMPPTIGKEQIEKALATWQKYKSGKDTLEQRIIRNEEWWRLRHTLEVQTVNSANSPEMVSAWLFNVNLNQHADAMDNYPMLNILPREKGDEDTASILSSVVPVILEQNQFEDTYSDVWWYKLKFGAGVYGVFWNPKKYNGLGDIETRKIDLLNLFWEPGILDIQNSANIFHVEEKSIREMQQAYPQLVNKVDSAAGKLTKYQSDDTTNDNEKTLVFDWYYKGYNGTQTVLHYCKFCSGEVLYASENDPAYKMRGFYDHAKYPFVIDNLYPIETSPVGFGNIDMLQSNQQAIDLLGKSVVKSALMRAGKRFLYRGDSTMNLKQFSTGGVDFIRVEGNDLKEENFREIEYAPIGADVFQARNDLINEMKETSGNRDSLQGGTTGGVNSASGLALQQEVGAKLPRDKIKTSYRAITEVGKLVIELLRQFYDQARTFRIVGENGTQYAEVSNAGLAPVPQGTMGGVDMGSYVPVFDISIKPQRNSPYNRAAQNEQAKEMYRLGFFDPARADQALMALEFMDLDDKQELIQKISQNGTMVKMIQQMMQVAMGYDQMNNTSVAIELGKVLAQAQGAQMPQMGGSSANTQSNSLGAIQPAQDIAGRAKAQAAKRTEVQA